MEEVVTEINILYIYIYFRYAIFTYTVSFRLNVLHLSSPFFGLASKSERLSKRSMPLHKKVFLNDGLIKASCHVSALLTQCLANINFTSSFGLTDEFFLTLQSQNEKKALTTI